MAEQPKQVPRSYYADGELIERDELEMRRMSDPGLRSLLERLEQRWRESFRRWQHEVLGKRER